MLQISYMLWTETKEAMLDERFFSANSFIIVLYPLLGKVKLERRCEDTPNVNFTLLST